MIKVGDLVHLASFGDEQPFGWSGRISVDTDGSPLSGKVIRVPLSSGRTAMVVEMITHEGDSDFEPHHRVLLDGQALSVPGRFLLHVP
jgi:hypothetical protein